MVNLFSSVLCKYQFRMKVPRPTSLLVTIPSLLGNISLLGQNKMAIQNRYIRWKLGSHTISKASQMGLVYKNYDC